MPAQPYSRLQAALALPQPEAVDRSSGESPTARRAREPRRANEELRPGHAPRTTSSVLAGGPLPYWVLGEPHGTRGMAGRKHLSNVHYEVSLCTAPLGAADAARLEAFEMAVEGRAIGQAWRWRTGTARRRTPNRTVDQDAGAPAGQLRLGPRSSPAHPFLVGQSSAPLPLPCPRRATERAGRQQLACELAMAGVLGSAKQAGTCLLGRGCTARRGGTLRGSRRWSTGRAQAGRPAARGRWPFLRGPTLRLGAMPCGRSSAAISDVEAPRRHSRAVDGVVETTKAFMAGEASGTAEGRSRQGRAVAASCCDTGLH